METREWSHAVRGQAHAPALTQVRVESDAAGGRGRLETVVLCLGSSDLATVAAVFCFICLLSGSAAHQPLTSVPTTVQIWNVQNE